MEGPNGAATYGQLVTLALMKDANPVAQDVLKFFMTDQNYQDILALAPFGKVPVLESAVDGWKSSSDYFSNSPPATLDAIAAGSWVWRSNANSSLCAFHTAANSAAPGSPARKSTWNHGGTHVWTSRYDALVP